MHYSWLLDPFLKLSGGSAPMCRVLTRDSQSNQIMWVSTWRLAFSICVRLAKIAAAGPLPALGCKFVYMS